MIASTKSRRLYFGGRPPGLLAGTNGSRIAHCSSVSRVGNAEAFDIRVVFMPNKLTLTHQRIQGYFPDMLLEWSDFWEGQPGMHEEPSH